MTRLVLLLTLLAGLAVAPARASDAQLPELGSPYSPLVRQHFYEQLEKAPWTALGWELLAPGAGNFYSGLVTPAAATLGLSLLGASLWLGGAVSSRPALMWTGVGTFAAGRAYGLISAPLGAVLLNAAFRRQLGISASY
ncbi:MAG: hypothetical protein JWN04_5126 [Myxococcaceae bacterium]|nr:hypothetical protein [Myxococcaceae bacterium]